MNPTDQARKEARRRELKKNKKQRQLVRTAVIKGKNPTEIILELEKLDDVEFNVLVPPPLNEKVMREKRRKLLETWTRVVHLYEKEDFDQHLDLKKMWSNYLKRKEEVMDHYDAVKTAQTVDVDDIPLPSNIPDDKDHAGDIPLPPFSSLQPKTGILKKSSVLDSLRPRTCPGVPAGAPPKLDEYDTIDEIQDEQRSKKIRFATKDEEDKGPTDVQKKLLQASGQDVDAYMKEMEEVHKKTEAEKAAEFTRKMGMHHGAAAPVRSLEQPVPPGEAFVQVPPGPGFMVRAPGIRPGMAPPGVRLPPGPPPGRPQLPPGPPPGRPPFMVGQRPPGGHQRPRPHMPRPLNPQVVSAGPQLNAGPSNVSKSVKTGSVIEAKPQMRNLMSDVTRFVPTNVKVKRGPDGSLPANPAKRQVDPMREVFAKHAQAGQPVQQQPPKDDAYAQFMAEMEKMM